MADFALVGTLENQFVRHSCENRNPSQTTELPYGFPQKWKCRENLVLTTAITVI